MPPSGLAIIIGAGPNTGTGIARILSSPSNSNLALALLSRTPATLSTTKSSVLRSNPSAVVETFPSSTSAADLDSAFAAIRAHPSFRNLPLTAAVYNVKHASKKPFLEETTAAYTTAQEEYQGGAVRFAQLALGWMLENEKVDAAGFGREKKGTLIFTGTLGALRTNAQFASYGASRAGVRMLAQALAKEFSERGVQVVHVIANGKIVDGQAGEEEGAKVGEGRWMSADDVGREYAHLIAQKSVWTHEFDMRPPLERF